MQNLLTFRFANPIFETTWNRDRLEAVEITVAEDLGIGSRADYYESAGAMRDMVQNHLTQLMTLVAMEAPSGFTAEAIRNEKVQVLESIRLIDPEHVVYGRYTAGTVGGRSVVGYLEEEDVSPDSTTPTFVGAKVEIHSWRWEGVPFYLRTGKRLPRRTTQIAITYKRAPVCLFHGVSDECPIRPNVIVLTMQPHEGFEIRFELKSPGTETVVSKPMSFDYQEDFTSIPDAYQTLLHDVMIGDQTLFVRADEVEASWALWTPIIERSDIPIHPYAAGTWGPAATNETLALWTDEWTMRAGRLKPKSTRLDRGTSFRSRRRGGDVDGFRHLRDRCWHSRCARHRQPDQGGDTSRGRRSPDAPPRRPTRLGARRHSPPVAAGRL